MEDLPRIECGLRRRLVGEHGEVDLPLHRGRDDPHCDPELLREEILHVITHGLGDFQSTGPLHLAKHVTGKVDLDDLAQFGRMGDVKVHLLSPLARRMVTSEGLVRGTDELFGKETHCDAEYKMRENETHGDFKRRMLGSK